MKKLIFLFLIVFVSSCIDTSEENKQLKEINYQLRSENHELTQKKESILRSYQSTKEIISSYLMEISKEDVTAWLVKSKLFDETLPDVSYSLYDIYTNYREDRQKLGTINDDYFKNV